MSDDPNIWREVFSPLSQALAFFGGLGGLVKAMVQRLDWRETLRVVIVGSGTAFGMGALSPIALRHIIGEIPDDLAGTLGVLCASAFMVGVVAVALVERFISRTHADEKTP